jgi:putative transposase
MPPRRRYFPPGQLQFVTDCTYHRTRLFDSPRFRAGFIEVLGRLRHEMGFLLIGWVLMPEHYHLLFRPQPAESTSKIMQELNKQTAQVILETLRAHQQHPWCGRMLKSLALPPTVHSDARCRVWQRRFYPFNVHSDKKQWEKMDYMHNNPVRRKLVASPEQWPWSSFRFYYLNDSSILSMDRLG